MKISMEKLCMVFSHAFDVIENEQLGASENHSLRVAVMCVAMGRWLGFDDDAISAIATCGMFHDSALTEYHLSQEEGEQQEKNMILHCEKGQDNVSWLPFKTSIDKFVLYHHERGDGKGPFKKKEHEIPVEAAIIAAADAVDATHHLQFVPADELPALRDELACNAEMYSTKTAVDALLGVLDVDLLEKMRDENIMASVEAMLPHWEVELSDPKVIYIGEFIARVIDYKSVFTHMHTSQIANRAWIMADHYGYGPEERNAVFLAASLHDIGKIATPIEILDKPGRLDDEEFSIIQQHVRNTNDWLRGLPDFDQIRHWAADHHEKLSGSGYPVGKSDKALDFNVRLITCLDIYQALSEPRPYHRSRTHKEAMQILYDMSQSGYIDAQIVSDLDEVMEKYAAQSIPSPVFSGEYRFFWMRGADDAPVPNGFRCITCGYFEEGDSLPDGFTCPVCGHDKSYFTKTISG